MIFCAFKEIRELTTAKKGWWEQQLVCEMKEFV
jgi:hypothetical protein